MCILTALLQAGGAREAVLFTFSDKPSLLSSIASDGFALMPDPAIIPLLPKHVYALTAAADRSFLALDRRTPI